MRSQARASIRGEFRHLPSSRSQCVFPPSGAMLEPRRSSSPWPPALHKRIPFDIDLLLVPFCTGGPRGGFPFPAAVCLVRLGRTSTAG